MLVFTIKNCSLAFRPDPIIIANASVASQASLAPLPLGYASGTICSASKVDVKHIFLFVYKHSQSDRTHTQIDTHTDTHNHTQFASISLEQIIKSFLHGRTG